MIETWSQSETPAQSHSRRWDALCRAADADAAGKLCGPIVYLLGPTDGPIKVGWTSGYIFDRLQELQTGNHHELFLVASLADDQNRALETRLHRTLRPWRIRGEWFARDAALRSLDFIARLARAAVLFDSGERP